MHDSGTFLQVMDPFVTFLQPTHDDKVTYIKNGMENRLRRLRGNKFIYQTKLHLLFTIDTHLHTNKPPFKGLYT